GSSVIRCVVPGTGRMPAGLEPGRFSSSGCELGAFWARAAHLEAASVPAFGQLARELRAHGAPPHLVRAAQQAAREERGHARITRALARHHGASVPEVVVPPVSPRTRAEVAEHNAAEGCARETFGAAVAGHQAEAVAEPSLRRLLGRIADDEAGHAE